MALKKCKECGHDVAKSAKACPNCGNKLKADDLGCGSAILIIIMALFVASFFMSGDNKEDKKDGHSIRIDFRADTMKTCLEKVIFQSGFGIDALANDTPDKVSGWFKNGKMFSCSRKVTGTRGVFFEGYFFKYVAIPSKP